MGKSFDLRGLGLTGLVLVVGVWGARCGGPSPDLQELVSDTARVETAVRNLRSGAVLARINEGETTPDAFTLQEGVLWDGALPWAEPAFDAGRDGQSVAGVPEYPCPEARVATGAGPETYEDALRALGACMRRELEAANVLGSAQAYLRLFSRGLVEKSFSRMSMAEIAEFLKKNSFDPMSWVGRTVEQEPLKARLRNSFSDREVDELVRLAQRRKQAIAVAEGRIFAMVDAHRALVDRFAMSSNRYRLLVALRDTANQGPDKTGMAVLEALRGSGMRLPLDLIGAHPEFLHPMAILAVVPDDKRELSQLDPASENPVTIVRQLLAELAGSEEMVKRQRASYAMMRERGNPAMPGNPGPAPRAVRVAVTDTGVDYLRYPELGVFLSNGKNGSMRSRDFADDDDNPYLPADGIFNHGTGTAATVLTTLAHHAPEVLRARKLDLAFWKVETERGYLSTPFMGAINWNSRMGLQESLLSHVNAPQGELLPQIVSVSWVFPMQATLDRAKLSGALLASPWLWVMAAGNHGVEVGKGASPSCFSDVRSDERPSSRILCVGALKRGILEDRIAGYSNYGDKVDVYAFDSYIGLCPSGTSCATPAVAGAAAVLAAKYPGISPERIRALIIEASQERELSVDPDGRPQADLSVLARPARTEPVLPELAGGVESAPQGRALEKRRVRVFDPATMMGRLLKKARARLGAPARL